MVYTPPRDSRFLHVKDFRVVGDDAVDAERVYPGEVGRVVHRPREDRGAEAVAALDEPARDDLVMHRGDRGARGREHAADAERERAADRRQARAHDRPWNAAGDAEAVVRMAPRPRDAGFDRAEDPGAEGGDQRPLREA